MLTDDHVLENHDKIFVDKTQNILCVECISKIFFNKSPLYKKYLLFKSINDIYSIKSCYDFRHHFSFFLLDHTLFLSDSFSFLEGISKINDDYAYSVNSELIKLATNACKEFLNVCTEDLYYIFKDAIYTCVLVRLKKFSKNKRKYFFIFKFLKNLIDNVEIIHCTLKDEPSIIEEFMNIFIRNHSHENNSGNEENFNSHEEKEYFDEQNDKNNEILLTLQIIYKLWCENSLWQINKDLLKNFFINLIKNFKFINKKTDLCSYYIEFFYIITKSYNDINYFFNTIIYDINNTKKIDNKTIISPYVSTNKNKNDKFTTLIMENEATDNKYKNKINENEVRNNEYKNKINENEVRNNEYKNKINENEVRDNEYNNKINENEYNKNENNEVNDITGKKYIYQSKIKEEKGNEYKVSENEYKNKNYKEDIGKSYLGNYCHVKYNSSEFNEINDQIMLNGSNYENEIKLMENENYNDFIRERDSSKMLEIPEEKNLIKYKMDLNKEVRVNLDEEYSNCESITCESNFFKSENYNIKEEKENIKYEEKKLYYCNLNLSNCSINSKIILSDFDKNNISKDNYEEIYNNSLDFYKTSEHLDESIIYEGNNKKILEKNEKSAKLITYKSPNINNLNYMESNNLDSIEKNNINLRILEKSEDLQIFIILCDNLQETLLNNFNSNIQMKCLDIFYKFCDFDEQIINIIISNTSLVEWIFDFISNTKYENLREKALNFLITFFFNNSLFSHTHAHYMLDVLINVILKYVNKSDNIYNGSNNFSFFFYFLKALNMLISITYSSIRIFHIFKIINIITFLVISPNTIPTDIKDIILFFESIIIKKREKKTTEYENLKENQMSDKNYHKIYKSENNEIEFSKNKKKKIILDNSNNKKQNYINDVINTSNKHKNDKNNNNNINTDEYNNNISYENFNLNDLINKVYVTNILALFKILKISLNIIKIVNTNKQEVYLELIYNEQNDFLNDLALSIIKLLFALIFILNKNEDLLINLNVVNEKENSDNENEFQILNFIKSILYFLTELHYFFRISMKENNNNFEKDMIYFIKFLYLSCIFIFDNINKRKNLFKNISSNVFFSSFFNPFFHLFSNILSHVDCISQSYIFQLKKNSNNDIDIEQEEYKKTEKGGNKDENEEQVEDEDEEEEEKKKKEKKKNQEDENNLIIDKFIIYKKRMREVLIKNKPFTLFFQYVSHKNYNFECYRILNLLIYEEDKIFKEKKNLKDILIEIIKKNDFYFSKVLLFNFNDNEGIIETVIYIFYLSLNYDKVFIEKKLSNSKTDNFVENIFLSNDSEININPFFLFMSLSYSYYFITKEKILIVFNYIKKEMHKINLQLWLDIKKIKNIYFAFDCLFSIKINSSNYNNFFSFIIYIMKLELSLHSSKQMEQIDNRLYLCISKNKDLVKNIFENVEMDKIQNSYVIYVYYLIIKLRKYTLEYSKSLSLYKMMSTIIRYMNTLENKSEEINDIFSFFFIFFENLEVYAQTDIFNIITLLQKLSIYVKNSLKEYFNKQSSLMKKIELRYNFPKFENSFFYFLLNLILHCRRNYQIQNINVLSSSISLIRLLIYSIQSTDNHFKSLSLLILSLLILPLHNSTKTVSPLLVKLSTTFDKNTEDILSQDDKSLINLENNKEKFIIRKNLFYPLVNSQENNIRVSSLSLLLSLLLTNDVILPDEEAFSFFIFLINSSFLNEWDDIQNDLLFAIINVLLLSTILNLRTKSFCFNYIYSFRPFFLRNILPLNRNHKIIIHKLFFLLLTVKIKPLWFDLKSYSEKILKILLNVVTKKDLDIMTFNCISSLSYETFIINKEDNNNNANKNVIENLEEYLETYKKNIKNTDGDICYTSFNKIKCENIDYDVVITILNITKLLLYK
ncbi:conserved Plasmodium protein, unknown function [Plasmodium gallinaceum]|uniref:Uncharacterized protein n=1 Tax=Plasmodium gallinaceum TaxID=5849 RepID=A0A1J1GWE7_PLAGA|nr:conserved Plasmodium protein, unknown function [Plasmodium gallinaceum]CRG95629.1 conserved Plasmodium protein, unknown function [Plasmodium gallinaceum]